MSNNTSLTQHKSCFFLLIVISYRLSLLYSSQHFLPASSKTSKDCGLFLENWVSPIVLWINLVLFLFIASRAAWISPSVKHDCGSFVKKRLLQQSDKLWTLRAIVSYRRSCYLLLRHVGRLPKYWYYCHNIDFYNRQNQYSLIWKIFFALQPVFGSQ